FLGGDHVLAAGTIPGLAARAAEAGQPLFLLWLDAHADFHTLATTGSGHLHGVPLAYVCGQPGFDGFPRPLATVPPDRVCLMGARSIDAEEGRLLSRTGMTIQPMRALDETGPVPLLDTFLDRVAAVGGRLHVSLD